MSSDSYHSYCKELGINNGNDTEERVHEKSYVLHVPFSESRFVWLTKLIFSQQNPIHAMNLKLQYSC